MGRECSKTLIAIYENGLQIINSSTVLKKDKVKEGALNIDRVKKVDSTTYAVLVRVSARSTLRDGAAGRCISSYRGFPDLGKPPKFSTPLGET